MRRGGLGSMPSFVNALVVNCDEGKLSWLESARNTDSRSREIRAVGERIRSCEPSTRLGAEPCFVLLVGSFSDHQRTHVSVSRQSIAGEPLDTIGLLPVGALLRPCVTSPPPPSLPGFHF